MERNRILTANTITPSMSKLLRIINPGVNQPARSASFYNKFQTGQDEFGRQVIIFEGGEFVKTKTMSTGEEKWKCKVGVCPACLRTVGTGPTLMITGTENLTDHLLKHAAYLS